MNHLRAFTVTLSLFAMVWWYTDAGCFLDAWPNVRMSFKQAETFIRKMEEAHQTEGRHLVIRADWEITPFYGVEKQTSCGTDATSM